MKTKKSSPVLAVVGLILLVAGVVCSILARGGAIGEGAGDTGKLLYALSLILALVGLVTCIAGLLRGRSGLESRKTDVRTLALASLFAALCYIGFSFFKIDIPVGTEKTAFHLGNVFCVLAALFLGGLWGGMAGAVGMTIADLTSGYVTSAPKTFLLKLCIGLIVGLVARRVFHLDREQRSRKRVLGTVVSSACGMAFNVVADPVVGRAPGRCRNLGQDRRRYHPGERRGGRGSRQRLLPGPPPCLGTCRPAEKGRLIVSVKTRLLQSLHRCHTSLQILHPTPQNFSFFLSYFHRNCYSHIATCFRVCRFNLHFSTWWLEGPLAPPLFCTLPIFILHSVCDIGGGGVRRRQKMRVR